MSITPGEFLQKQMNMKGMTSLDLSRRLMFSHLIIDDILADKMQIDEELARRLWKIFGVTVDEWMKVQKDYNRSKKNEQ